MSKNFPSFDELCAMTLDRLRSQIPYDQEDEKLMQEAVNSKVRFIPEQSRAYRNDIPDIKTPEEEAKYQAIIDERELKIRQAKFGEEVVLEEQIEKLEEEKIKIEEELKVEGELVKTEIPESQESPISDVKCEICQSKGFRHKKGCPKANKE